ncbi:purine-nucleoside phosphorylase [Myxococcota bacterium]|nr:purine-nucleoside phosphorylase [Myxococcota bacterium]
MKQSEKIKETTDYILRRSPGFSPAMGLILGSGLGNFAESIENATVIPYGEIPNFPQSSVSGHAGNLILGNIGTTPVAVMQGRVHFYEGHSMEKVIFPARTLVALGCKTLLITNAAGGIGPDLNPGDLVLISDHLNLMGESPLKGPNEEVMGPRFPDMSDIYSRDLRKRILDIANSMNITLKEGIYAAMMGPSYETPAEVNMAKILGANMVGMSTVPEAIAAHHMGASIIGISCISNLAAGISTEPLSHDEVKETAAKIAGTFRNLIVGVVTGLR